MLLLIVLPDSLPAQPVPPLAIQAVTLQGGNFSFSFLTEECQTYEVMHTADLTPPATWTTLAQVAGNGSVITVTDPAAGTQPARYYSVSFGMVASVNTVGYVRRMMQPGTNLVANPFYTANNTIGSLLPNCPDGSEIFKTSGSPNWSVFFDGAWQPANLTLNPGEGAILVNPAAPFEAAFVGEVPQGMFPFGGLTNPLSVGLSLKSSIAPVNGLLNFPAQEGDMIQAWNASNQTGVWHEYLGGSWWDPLPVIRPGDAFWVLVSQPTNWVQSFSAYSVGGGWGPPVIANQPQSLTNAVGTTAKFSVAATGAPLAYQWYFNTNTLLTNKTSCSLTLSNVQPSDAGTYTVIITNFSGSVTSSVAKLMVLTSTPTYGDDFNDNVNDPSRWGTDIHVGGTNASLVETNSRLDFAGSGAIARPWIYSFGSYTQDWELILDVNLGNMVLTKDTSEPNNWVGLALFSSDAPLKPDGTPATSLDFGLGLTRLAGQTHRAFGARMYTNDLLATESVALTTNQHASLRVTFDFATKTLTSWHDASGDTNAHHWTGLSAQQINVPPIDWGMTESSAFRFAVVGVCEDYTVTASDQVYVDNFVLIGSVPPPVPYTYTTNNGTITITGYTGVGGDMAIPSTINGLSVTSIGNEAFQYVSTITSATIPNSVTRIGDAAFSRCSSLTSVTIPDGVTRIGDEAFEHCPSLLSVTVPASVTSIGSNNAFSDCASLLAITVNPLNSVYSSVDGVLFNKSTNTLIQCPGGKAGSVTIPSSVTTIGDEAFSYCTSLTAITVDALNSLFSSVDGALFNKSTNTLIAYPGGKVGDYTIPNGVTHIGDDAFRGCTRLTGVTIPNSITSIGADAFESCSSLASVTIPYGVTRIESSTFQRCSSLTSVAIPTSVTGIGYEAFESCTSLTNVIIGSGVTGIWDTAFGGCTNLTGVYFQGNVPSLGADVFTGDDSATVYYLAGTTGWGSTFGGRPTALWSPCLNIAADDVGHPMGAPLALHVRSFDCATSNAIPSITAVVRISTAGTTRTNYVTTDGTGQATVYFQPLAGEAGHYEVSAGLPSQPSPPAQGSFSIVGIGFGTNQAAHRLIVGVPATNHIELRNLTDVPLSGIAVSLVNAPSDVTFQAITPVTILGNGTNTLTYVLKATAGGANLICLLRVTSAEGATNELPVVVEITPPVPRLVVTPASLHAAMLRGAQSLATFQVANLGGASSGDLEILLPGDPAASWLGLVSPPVIPDLPPNAQAEVTLSLAPSSNLPLGPYTGGVALWNTNAGQTDVPFQFDCVSALKGNLRVTVVDEFTYYAAGAPKVTNATVRLLDPYVRTNITSAVTDADGVALFTNLTESYYEVQVAASQHGSFDTVVLVPGSQTFNLTAFLARQMVSYRWIVTTQAITDRYIFTLDTRFETEVPAPVLRVEPGALNLCDYEDNAEDNWVVNLTIFNSGLITAKEARLFFGNHPRYAITPLTDYLGDIPAGSSLVVPVIIHRLAGNNDGPSQIEAHLDWQLPTGETTRYYRVPISVYNAGLHDCDPSNPGSVPTSPPILWSGEGWSGGGGTGGSGGIAPIRSRGTSPTYPHLTYPPVFPSPQDPIVPVQVGVQLSQSAVMTRQAFEAFLDLTNGSSGSLSSLEVVIDIRDSNGQSANDQFGIRSPDLAGLNAVDGSGTLAAFGSGSANWTIIPTTNAAPTGPTRYTVGGSLTFQQSGTTVQIPLFAVPITVFPAARLVVDYFWERMVYSDDPFTPEIEPVVPFSVGLRIKNAGLGQANAVQITSAQPQIVDNVSGLLVDFQLVGLQVGSQVRSPALTATLGEITSGSNAVAAWWMTASLQGRFTNYSAAFSHLDDLGQGNLSLVDTIAIHPLIHVVRADRPTDDLVPDFLVNDGYLTNTLPDGLYLSDGSVAPVASVTSGSHNGPPSPVHTNVLLTASLPPGWIYLRIPDPGPGVPLTNVKRSDGRFLGLDYNVWTTHRIIHPLNGDPPFREDFLHLLDFDSTGSYTLGYSVAPQAPLQFCCLSVSNGILQMRLDGPAGVNAVVDTASNLTTWTPWQTNALPAGGLPLSMPMGANRQFFRARIP